MSASTVPDGRLKTLREGMDHEPVVLGFGTSGRRGLVKDLTPLEIYVNALGEIEFLKSLALADGGIVEGDAFYIAADLRPSSTRPIQPYGGEIAQVILKAVQDGGLVPCYLGQIPTPALALFALKQGKGSVMVTGSHIPFDRNGYKTNTSRGELMKDHERRVQSHVEKVRSRIYGALDDLSPFDSRGCFKEPLAPLPDPGEEAVEVYIRRYVDFMGANALVGLRVLFYQHSAVGRELIPRILRDLGAEVVCCGLSENFVPIDTENVDEDCLETITRSVQDTGSRSDYWDAVISTDGDSDRPLILAWDSARGALRFFGGDLVGMVTAQFLDPDAIVVPISCNDGIDRGTLSTLLTEKTRIGSPYVIEGMLKAVSQGKTRVVGWEANGGFLTASELERKGRKLASLPTRDAVLPILAVLASALESGCRVSDLFDQLPQRFGKSALLRNFPRARSQTLLRFFGPPEDGVLRFSFSMNPRSEREKAILDLILRSFGGEVGLGYPGQVDYRDGVRISFSEGEVVHLRASGNADELRIYVLSDSKERAEHLSALAVREPDGILRRLESALLGPSQAAGLVLEP